MHTTYRMLAILYQFEHNRDLAALQARYNMANRLNPLPPHHLGPISDEISGTGR
jgi:hypothetical protein